MTRNEALALGLVRFTNDRPCRRGHYERYVSTGTCVQCVKDRAAKWAAANPEKLRATRKKAEAKRKRVRVMAPKIQRNRTSRVLAADDRVVFGLVYIITNTVNGKQYVGITSHSSLTNRWWRHRRAAEVGSLKTPLCLAMRKYGFDAFSIKAVACGRKWSDLQEMERVVIDQYGTLASEGRGYNVTAGGDGALGVKPSAETLQKRAAKSGWKLSEETRARYRARVITDQTRAKLRAARQRRVTSDETRAKMSVARKGKSLSEKAKENMSIAQRGRVFSDETRAKMSASAKARSLAKKKVTMT